ncbi:MAG: hypothetical protein WAS73_06665 [Defluviicoccus sp.]
MADCWFQIDLAMPVAMTAELQRDIVVAIRPRWHVSDIEMQRLEDGVFRLKLSIISEGDVLNTASNDELREFRDLVVSLVAFSVMVPVKMMSKGVFDFPVSGKQRKQKSLGPMKYEFPPMPLSDLQPLVFGFALQPKYASAVHFFWEALNSEHPLYRFINLAVAVELLVRHDSPVRGSRHPSCGDSKCGYQLEHCPECNRPWKIPSQLRERAAFLLPADLLPKFIAARNQVFHGLSDALHHDYSNDLPELNCSLFVVLRNYLGQQMGLPTIGRDQLGVALNPPGISVTIFYTLP